MRAAVVIEGTDLRFTVRQRRFGAMQVSCKHVDLRVSLPDRSPHWNVSLTFHLVIWAYKVAFRPGSSVPFPEIKQINSSRMVWTSSEKIIVAHAALGISLGKQRFGG